MTEIQHAAEPRPAGDLVTRPVLIRRGGLLLDRLSTEPLMKAFSMVVGHEFLDHVPEMSLAKEDKVIQALAGHHRGATSRRTEVLLDAFAATGSSDGRYALPSTSPLLRFDAKGTSP
jgi:hypothetical protein